MLVRRYILHIMQIAKNMLIIYYIYILRGLYKIPYDSVMLRYAISERKCLTAGNYFQKLLQTTVYL